MTDIFAKILNMSMAASWMILAVILLRFIFKRLPKWSRCVLWALVAFRLICPFTIESSLSLIPRSNMSVDEVISDLSFQSEEEITDVQKQAIDYLQNDTDQTPYYKDKELSVKTELDVMTVLSFIWLTGMSAMFIYAAVSYIRLYSRVRISIPVKDHLWICDAINTPFILGIINPRIYIPSTLDEAQTESVAAHEYAHLRRYDYLWKPFGFLLLAVYWFHPLCWVAYILLCRDIELACDEKVVKNMDSEGRKLYSEALLSCSIQTGMITACPLAFGEVGVKERVKSVLHYKKPAFWVIVSALAICIIVSVCFLTNPKEPEDNHIAGMETVIEGQFYHFPITSTMIDNQFFSMEVPQEMVGKVNCILKVRTDKDGYTLDSVFFYDNAVGKLIASITTPKKDGFDLVSGGGWLGSIFWEDLTDYYEWGVLDDVVMRSSSMDIALVSYCYDELFAPVGKSSVAVNHNNTGAYFFIQPTDVQYPLDDDAAADLYFALESALDKSAFNFTPKSFPMDKSYLELHDEGKLPEEYSLNDKWSSVLTDFQIAEEAYAWFKGYGEINTNADMGQFTRTLDQVTINYEAVSHMEFSTLNELEAFLGSLFPEKVVKELMQTKLTLGEEELPLFTEEDGRLYVAKGNIGNDNYDDYERQYLITIEGKTATIFIQCIRDVGDKKIKNTLKYTMIMGKDHKWRVTDDFELPIKKIK